MDAPIDANTQIAKPQPSATAPVGSWAERIENARSFWRKAYERVKVCRELAYYGDEKWWDEGDLYVAGLMVRHLGRLSAALYARDPQVEIVPDTRVQHFALWDGRAQTYMSAMEGAALGDPDALALLEDIQRGRAEMEVTRRFGATLATLVQRSWTRRFRLGMRSAVRRALTDGVAWTKVVWIGDRVTPDMADAVDDVRTAAVLFEMARREAEEDGGDRPPPLMPGRPPMVEMEGLLYTWPSTTDVVVDPELSDWTTLDGAMWIAERHVMRAARAAAIYGVKVEDLASSGGGEDEGEITPYSKVEIWEVWDRRTRTVTHVLGGDGRVLAQWSVPLAPVGFFPYVPLIFNPAETPEKGMFPQSDVWMLRHIVRDYNTRRQAVREHVRATRPRWIYAEGSLDRKDIEKLIGAKAFTAIPLASLQPGQKVADLLQSMPVAPMPPELADTGSLLADFQLASGTNEVVLGNVPGEATATAVSAAEQARTTEVGAHGAALDEALGEIARKAASLWVQGAEAELVMRLAGWGAYWPDLQQRMVLWERLRVDVRAGSSGRPNAAAESVKLERLLPILLQIPGLDWTPVLRRLLEVLDIGGIDLEVVQAEALPSVTALNAMVAKGALPGMTPDGFAGGMQPSNVDPRAQAPATGVEQRPTGGDEPKG